MKQLTAHMAVLKEQAGRLMVRSAILLNVAKRMERKTRKYAKSVRNT